MIRILNLDQEINMKIEIDEQLYFNLLKKANDRNISIQEHISRMNDRYTDMVYSNPAYTQKELDQFNDWLNFTLDETIDAQIDLVDSDVGTWIDKRMIDVLKVMFGRATRDKEIYNEMIRAFYYDKQGDGLNEEVNNSVYIISVCWYWWDCMDAL